MDYNNAECLFTVEQSANASTLVITGTAKARSTQQCIAIAWIGKKKQRIANLGRPPLSTRNKMRVCVSRLLAALERAVIVTYTPLL